MRTRVKICCISSREEARAAIDAGADALGLVGDMPSGPGVITDARARELAECVPPPLAAVLLTSRTQGGEIADHVEYCGAGAVQVVQHIDPAEYLPIRKRLPHVRRIQVIHVEGRDALDLIELYSPHVHAFLLDSGRPSAATPELGGTGRAHDWAISREFVARSQRPVFLAGGLGPDNVREAIGTVRPWGVDLCSGVRTGGVLDTAKLAAFMHAVRAADTQTAAPVDAG